MLLLYVVIAAFKSYAQLQSPFRKNGSLSMCNDVLLNLFINIAFKSLCIQ